MTAVALNGEFPPAFSRLSRNLDPATTVGWIRSYELGLVVGYSLVRTPKPNGCR